MNIETSTEKMCKIDTSTVQAEILGIPVKKCLRIRRV